MQYTTLHRWPYAAYTFLALDLRGHGHGTVLAGVMPMVPYFVELHQKEFLRPKAPSRCPPTPMLYHFEGLRRVIQPGLQCVETFSTAR